MKKEYQYLFNRAQRKQIAAGKLFEHIEGEFIVLRDKHGAFNCKRYIGIQADTTEFPGYTKSGAPPDPSAK